MNWSEKVSPKTFDPIRTIEWVVALCTLAGATYIFTPLYDLTCQHVGPNVIATILSHPAAVSAFSLLLMAGALLVMLGLYLHKPNVRGTGWFIIIIARLFQILSTLIVVGPLPITWIYPFTIMLVAVVLWGWARLEVHRDAH